MTHTKTFIPFFILVFTILTLTSCDKKDEIIEALTESDAIEIIESTLQSNAGGLTSNLEDATEQLITALSSGNLCDSLYTKSVDKNHQGIQLQATYNSVLMFEITCNNLDIPQTTTFTVGTTSTNSTPRIDSNDSGDFMGNIAGLQPSAQSILIDGSYSRSGTQILDFINQTTINSIFSADLTELAMDKQNYSIESGSGTFSFTGSNKGSTFSYTGDIVFNGDNSATLTINGNIHELNWN